MPIMLLPIVYALLPTLTPTTDVAPSRTASAVGRQLSRRAVLGAFALPLLTPNAAHAGLVKSKEDISPERLAQLEKNRGPLLGTGEQAYRIVCDRDDEECLKKKREMAAPKIPFSDGPVTKEARSEAIKKQAKACRAFCGRVSLADCDGRDTECLAAKRAEMEAQGAADGADLAPYLGVAAAVVVAAVVRAPEKTDNPKGMQIREGFYEKRKRDTAELAASGVTDRSALEAATANKAEKLAAEAAAAADADADSAEGGPEA